MVTVLSAANGIQAERARKSFAIFAKEAWHVIEPGRPYVGGWHLDAIAEHLEAVSRGDIKKLLVNMPPRHGKSSYIDVLWSVWLLLNQPSIRLLCGSYALNLATRDNLKARRLIQSNWFQDRYSGAFQITKDQNAKMKFETNELGYRMAVSVGSAATGEGFDIGLIDDLHAIDEKESNPKREAAIDWFDNTWCTRLNDPQLSRMVVVGQRIHEQDVSGHILETNEDGEWIHLNLAAEYEEASPCVTYLPGKIPAKSERQMPSFTKPGVRYTLTFSHGEVVSCSCPDHVHHPDAKCKHMKRAIRPNPEQEEKPFWQDPRVLEGELLWPERFPRDVIEKAKKRHGVYGYTSLYQQRPVPPGGGTFKRKHERLFSITRDAFILHTPRGDKAVARDDCELFLTVDPAISEEQSADYMVIQTWAKTPIKDLLLLNCHRGRWSHKEQQDEVEEQFNDWNNDFAAVETVAYQHALFQDLIDRGVTCKPFKPHKDKVTRASNAAIWQENGKIYFLAGAPWLEDLRTELYKFPKTKHDDQVDALSLASIAARSQGPLSDETTDEEIPDPIEGPIQLLPDDLEPTEQEEQVEATQTLAERVPVLPVKRIDPFAWASSHGVWGDE